MSGTTWVDVIHSETGGRARVAEGAVPAHELLGWVVDDNPHSPDEVDPTDPVATSTPEPPAAPAVDVVPDDIGVTDDAPDSRDATDAATDTKED